MDLFAAIFIRNCFLYKCSALFRKKSLVNLRLFCYFISIDLIRLRITKKKSLNVTYCELCYIHFCLQKDVQ